MLLRKVPPLTTVPLSTAPKHETVIAIIADRDLAHHPVVTTEATVAAVAMEGNMDAIDPSRRLLEVASHPMEEEAQAVAVENGRLFVADQTTTQRPFKSSRAW